MIIEKHDNYVFYFLNLIKKCLSELKSFFGLIKRAMVQFHCKDLKKNPWISQIRNHNALETNRFIVGILLVASIEDQSLMGTLS